MLDRIRNLLRPRQEAKASIGQAQMLIGKDHSYTINDIKAYAKEGYAQNPTVFACISLIATSMARIPLRVYSMADDSEQQDTDFQRLIDYPNPDEGDAEFRTASASWLLLTGNCYMERLLVGGKPKELWNWQPYEMSVGRVKGSRIPARYTWRRGMEGERSWDMDLISGACDLLHWRTFNPSCEDNTFGLSPLSAAAAATDAYNAATKLRYNRMKNGLSIDGILSPSGDGQMDDKQRTELERKIREKYTGTSGLKVAVSNTKMEFTTMTTSMKDAEWTTGTKLNKQEICEVFRVPTQLLGIEGSQTYANFEQATKALYYLAVMPLLDSYCAELNRWLGGYFPGLYVGYSKSDIDALEVDRSARRQAKIASGAYSINEIRADFGDMPRPEPEADEVMTDASKIPLGMDVFSGANPAATDVAKALMRSGMSRDMAERKAMELLYDSKD